MDTEVKNPAETQVLFDESSGKNPDLQDNQIDPGAGGYDVTNGVGSTGAALPNELQGDPSKATLRHISHFSIFGDHLDVEATKPEEDGEQLVSNKLELDEEARESKKERLKKQRSLRFTIGEPHDSTQNLKVVDPVDAELQYMTEMSNSAISTPCQRRSETLDFEDLENGINIDAETLDETDSLLYFYKDDDDDDDDDYVELAPELKPLPSDHIDSLQAKNNFLDHFEIPSLSDISEDSDVALPLRIHHSNASTVSAVEVDTGRFVDPLTGEDISIVSSSSSSTTSEISEELTPEREASVGRMSLDYFNELMEIKKVVVINDEHENVFDRFTKSFIETATVDVDEEEINAINLQKETLQMTIDFMYELFNTVVDEVENMKTDMLLKRKLDKRKMFEALAEERLNYVMEKEMNTFLNTRMADYYRRLRNVRPFTALSNKSMEIEYAKYRKNLLQLDHYLQLAAQTKTKNSYLITSVSMDLSYVDNIVMTTEQHLESLMLSVLGNKSEYLRRITERELKLMRQKRNEISDARLNLITRKHTLGKIREKIDRLEKINEDICMEDFISIQNQVSALNKKIEERNIELKRLRLNYHSELHMTHHNREKSLAIACKLKEHNLQLQKRVEAQRVLRERLYKAKMERSRIRKQHSDLTFQGGILTMPALMHDFDDTVEKVNASKEKVNEMKETVVRLTQRISALETRCL